MTPEGRVKESIKRVLKQYGAYYHMPVQNGMGAPTLDFICCHKGRYLAIEAKAPHKIATQRQEGTMFAIDEAGGKTFCIDGPIGLAALRDWLEAA